MMEPEQAASVRLKSIEGFPREIPAIAGGVVGSLEATDYHLRYDIQRFSQFGGEIELFSELPF